MRFRELILEARAPDALVAWYREALGLRAAAGAPAGVVAGATVVRFERAVAAPAPYHVAFNVPENRLDDAVRWIDERADVIVQSDGAVVADAPTWDARSVYFADAEGNVLELIARRGIGNASSLPFGPRSLLEASEVGLPCPSVPDLVADLQRALGVPQYRPASPQFAPLGDERGLLVVVPEGREWFPGRGARRAVPLRVLHDGPPHDVAGLPYRFRTA